MLFHALFLHFDFAQCDSKIPLSVTLGATRRIAPPAPDPPVLTCTPPFTLIDPVPEIDTLLAIRIAPPPAPPALAPPPRPPDPPIRGTKNWLPVNPPPAPQGPWHKLVAPPAGPRPVPAGFEPTAGYPPAYPPAPGIVRVRCVVLVALNPSCPLASTVPSIFTAPCASQTTGPFKTDPVNLTVTPAAMVMFVKLKMLSPAGFSAGVTALGLAKQ